MPAMEEMMKYWDHKKVPEIKEITIYYTDVINGFKIRYRKCDKFKNGKFKHIVPANANT